MHKVFHTITIKGRKVDSILAVDAMAAKRIYCAQHPEVAREFVRAVKAATAYQQ